MLTLNTRKAVITAGALAALVTAAVLLVPRSLAAPLDGGGGLTKGDVRLIIDQAVAAAGVTPSPLRSLPGVPRTTRMHIAVVDRSGKLLGHFAMDDAWVGSEDIA